MAKQATKETYTYYSPEEPTGRVIADAPLVGGGRAWTRGKYIHPVYPSPLNVRVGDAGISVPTVISWLRASEDDKSRVLERYGQVLKPEDVDAAIWFYEQNQEAIDQELADEAEAS